MDMMEEYQNEQTGQERLESQLAPGEMLLWQGAPRKNARMAGIGVQRVFGALWLGFALFWEASALLFTVRGGYFSPFSLLFPIFGLPFVGVGIYIAIIAPGKERRRRARSLYAVTGQRVLIVDSLTGNLRSLPLSAIRGWSCRVRPDGSADLYFDTDAAYGYSAMVGEPARRSAISAFAFYATDAEGAQRAIQSAQQQA